LPWAADAGHARFMLAVIKNVAGRGGAFSQKDLKQRDPITKHFIMATVS